jgi:hypothetical protein
MDLTIKKVISSLNKSNMAGYFVDNKVELIELLGTSLNQSPSSYSVSL